MYISILANICVLTPFNNDKPEKLIELLKEKHLNKKIVVTLHEVRDHFKYLYSK